MNSEIKLKIFFFLSNPGIIKFSKSKQTYLEKMEGIELLSRRIGNEN